MAKGSLLFPLLLVSCLLCTRVALGDTRDDDDEFVEIMPKSTHVEDDDDEYADVVPVVVEEEEEEVEAAIKPPVAAQDQDEYDDSEVEQAPSDKQEESDAEVDTQQKAEPVQTKKSKPARDDVDEEEFEGFEDLTKPTENEYSDAEAEPEDEAPSKKPALSEAPVPKQALRTIQMNWDQYYLEIMMLFAVLAYGGGYLYGKSKNSSIAYAWFEAHQELLASNFAVVGDDGEGDRPSKNVVIREAEHIFYVHCSGRANCDSLLVELQLMKRQDLLQLLTQFIRPKSDAVQITVKMSAEDMDPFVFALAPKRNISRLIKEHRDLGFLSPEKRRGDQYGLPASLGVISETAEVLPALLSTTFVSTVKKYEELIDYIHFSDQFVPNIEQDEASKDDKAAQAAVAEALKSVQRVLIFRFVLPPHLRFTSAQQLEKLVPLMRMVLYSIDRVKKCRLSRDAKERALKNRSKMSEEISKLSHQQRQELAQERREKKLREEKERYMDEKDPEKARKLQEKALQREAKKKNPKMKTAILRRG